MATMKYVTYEKKGHLAIAKLCTPNSKMNIVCKQTIEDIYHILADVKSDPNMQALIVMSGMSDNFVAGVDISEFAGLKALEESVELSKKGQNVVQLMEDFPKPSFIIVHGICLGIGLEFSLGCRYRIAIGSPKTLFGVPEVLIGILPGAGGTQRLPRTVSLPDALDLMLTGRFIRAHKAKEIGLVDMVVDPPESPDEDMLQFVEKTAIDIVTSFLENRLALNKAKSLKRRLVDYALKFDVLKNIIFKKARAQVMKRTLGLYPAPLKIIEVVKSGLSKGLKAGYLAERMAFGELTMSSSSKSLFNIFFAQSECKKNSLIGTPEHEVKNVAILGSDALGNLLALLTVEKGYKVTLKDKYPANAKNGYETVKRGLETYVKRKKFTRADYTRCLSNFSSQLSYDHFLELDLVIENGNKDLESRLEYLEKCELLTPDHCIFAINSSHLPISIFSSESKKPDKVVGMHYFSPVDKTQLLEIVRTELTSTDTLAAAVSVGLKQGKVPIVVQDGPGFYTTRIFCAMVTEAIKILQTGIHPRKIEYLSRKFGFYFGICSMLDGFGMDKILEQTDYLRDVLGERFNCGEPNILSEFVDAGLCGSASKEGFFLYQRKSENSNKNPPINPRAIQILKAILVSRNRTLSDDDIQLRLALRFTNEAVMCLQEGIIATPTEGDIGAVLGLGFPPFLGGPFRWVDSFGAEKIVENLNKFMSEFGESFKPCDLLWNHAKDPSKKFYQN